VTPSLKTNDVVLSLTGYVLVYAVVYIFGFLYLYRLLHDGPKTEVVDAHVTPSRPLAVAAQAESGD